MAVNWHDLRPWNGSIQGAFEELCCQLASDEPTASGSIFRRKAAPDAGVECFWQLPNGDELAWQAKYFTSVPNANQWAQLDESVRTALDKHPRLGTYTICLPADRQDPRLVDQASFMTRWDDRVIRWTEWATAKGMTVQFVYWGSFELLQRLGETRNRGRLLFWFNKDLLTPEWFQNQVRTAIANVEARYSRTLNVDVPIARAFDGLGRSGAFYSRALSYRKRVGSAFSSTHLRNTGLDSLPDYDSLGRTVGDISDWLAALPSNRTEALPLSTIAEGARNARTLASSVLQALQSAANTHSAPADLPEGGATVPSQDRASAISSASYYLRVLTSELQKARDWVEGSEAKAANVGALLVEGEAGSGKTHLLCDVAIRRTDASKPTLLLLGEHFVDGDLWHQIITQVGRSESRDDFLDLLNAAAEASGHRAILLIDAINESKDRSVWTTQLGGMLAVIERYPWLSLGLSVRTSYTDLLIPRDIGADRLVRIEHTGFADVEYEALAAFFAHYGVQLPTVPLLSAEFRNPLFLKLFCVGLHNERITSMPRGFRGITTTFSFFLKSVNVRLAAVLDYDPRLSKVPDAARAIIVRMAEESRRWLTLSEADALLGTFLPDRGYDKSLRRNMVAEGVLSEDAFYTSADTAPVEGIRFAYDRFTDHLLCDFLLDKHLTQSTPEEAFAPDKPLGGLIKDEVSCWRNRGLLEALMIQLPERTGHELPVLVPRIAKWRPVCDAFVQSIAWRAATALGNSTREYINSTILGSREHRVPFWDAMLSLACEPGHPFNARLLHERLMRHSLPVRDSWWSKLVASLYGDKRSVDRIIDWAWDPHDKSHIEDEAVFLTGLTLSWFLTTPHRFARDRATKALVRLLSSRLSVLQDLLQTFSNVDDPYVTERLLAVAYGCATRTASIGGLQSLAQFIDKNVFSGQPPVHILARDYARNIVELAYARGLLPGYDITRVRPPYGAKWPSRFPSKKQIDVYQTRSSAAPRGVHGLRSIYNSVMSFGDFARYIIGTNSGHFPWFSVRLGDPAPLKAERRLYSQKDPTRFDLSKAQRWVMERVIELGWSEDLHGDYDSMQTSGDSTRAANKAERIGKKYQWMAWHEFLARVADNFHFRGDWADSALPYEGPWQISARDIDPSVLVKSTADSSPEDASAWWVPEKYDGFSRGESHEQWAATLSDFPDVPTLLLVTRHTDGSQWYVLDGTYTWSDHDPLGDDDERIHRQLFYVIRAFLVRREACEQFFTWASRQDFMGRWMPELREMWKMFLGEYYEGTPFLTNTPEGYPTSDWSAGGSYKQLPCEVMITSAPYLKESSSLDCSVDDSLIIRLPTWSLARGMGLHRDGEGEGTFVDKDRSVGTFDPSVFEDGPTVLLASKAALDAYLEANQLEVFWAVLGEKVAFPLWRGTGGARHSVTGAFRRSTQGISGELRSGESRD